MIYDCIRTFPKTEIFALTDQMKRAAVSVTSNVAEGFSRQSYKEKVQFYSMGQGSVTELQNQLIIAKDVGYLKEARFRTVFDQSVKVNKIMNGLIKSSKSIAGSSSLLVHSS